MAAINPRQRWINHILSLQVEDASQKRLNQGSMNYFRASQSWRFEETFPQKIELIANVAELARNFILLFKAIMLDPHKVTIVVEEDKKTKAEREAEQEKSRQKRAAIIGTAVILGAMGFIGYNLKSFKRQNKIYSCSQEILSKAQELPKSPMKNQIIRLFDLQRKIEKMRTFKERGYAVTALGLTFGAGALLVYGLGGAMKAKNIGYFLLIASTAIGIFNGTYHWKDAQKIERLQTEILGSTSRKGLADGILEQLRSNYTEDMELNALRVPAQASAPLPPLASAALPVFATAHASAPLLSTDPSNFVPIPVPTAPGLLQAYSQEYPILNTYDPNAEPPPSFVSPLSEEVDD